MLNANDQAGPCDDCKYTQRCTAGDLACDALAVYASGACVIRWQAAPRVPSRGLYEIMVKKIGQRLAGDKAA
jgi:hypothetical protein